jgi:hypothetical protein
MEIGVRATFGEKKIQEKRYKRQNKFQISNKYQISNLKQISKINPNKFPIRKSQA